MWSSTIKKINQYFKNTHLQPQLILIPCPWALTMLTPRGQQDKLSHSVLTPEHPRLLQDRKHREGSASLGIVWTRI